MGRRGRQRDRDRRSRGGGGAGADTALKGNSGGAAGTVSKSDASRDRSGTSSSSSTSTIALSSLTEESVWDAFHEYFRDVSDKDITFIDGLLSGAICRLDDNARDQPCRFEVSKLDIRRMFNAVESCRTSDASVGMSSGGNSSEALCGGVSEIDAVMEVCTAGPDQPPSVETVRVNSAAAAAYTNGMSPRGNSAMTSGKHRISASSTTSGGGDSKRMRVDRGEAESSFVVTTATATSPIGSNSISRSSSNSKHAIVHIVEDRPPSDIVESKVAPDSTSRGNISSKSNSNSGSNGIGSSDIKNDAMENGHNNKAVEPSVWLNVLGPKCGLSDTAYIDWFIDARRTNKTVRTRGRPPRNLVTLGPAVNSITKRKWSGVCPRAPATLQHPACWGPGTRVPLSSAVISSNLSASNCALSHMIDVSKFHPACVSATKIGYPVARDMSQHVHTPAPCTPLKINVAVSPSLSISTAVDRGYTPQSSRPPSSACSSNSSGSSTLPSSPHPSDVAQLRRGTDLTDIESPLEATALLSPDGTECGDAVVVATHNHVSLSAKELESAIADDGVEKATAGRNEVLVQSQSLDDVERDLLSLLNHVVGRNIVSLQTIRRRAQHYQSAGELRSWVADLQEAVAIAEASVVAPALKWRGVESAVNEATLHHLFLKYENPDDDYAHVETTKSSISAKGGAQAQDMKKHSCMRSRDLFRPGAMVEVLLEQMDENKDPNAAELKREWALMKVITVYRDGDENKFIKVCVYVI